jgi:hypothetical protein
MSAIFNKLNWKGHPEILILNAPASFEAELAALDNVTIRRSLDDIREVTFSLAFVTKQHEVDAFARSIAAKAKGDAVVWFAYPKGTSRNYTCEFNRDTGWAVLGVLGFEGVRQVAIDADWRALRFRRVAFIKRMVRDKSRAMTTQGRERVARKTDDSE